MSKLSNVVKNDVVKKTAYDKLATKVNNINTSEFALKTKFQIDKAELEKKIPDDLVKKAKLTELENKIPDVSSLATKTALVVLQKKIMTQKSVSLKKNLLIIIMTSILLLQSLKLKLLIILMPD